ANLGFKAAASAVEDFSPLDVGVESFDAVTMWFVIEHLRSLPAVLDKIHSMLEPGGVFAFSTPNYNGISRRRSAEGFLKSNPLDHYTIWSPSSARRLLSRHGFKLKRVKCPVIHPDRFFNAGFYDRLPSALRRIIGFSTDAAGRLLNFGDTFEVYAVKIKDSGRSA
ncbi:MAG TPA: acylneuraminate cytidylyltransferase, partial [Spirochaeta sp.]|nr:acylneuraminate cytidylyltransferase [Spirochaeta sp.]